MIQLHGGRGNLPTIQQAKSNTESSQSSHLRIAVNSNSVSKSRQKKCSNFYHSVAALLPSINRKATWFMWLTRFFVMYFITKAMRRGAVNNTNPFNSLENGLRWMTHGVTEVGVATRWCDPYAWGLTAISLGICSVILVGAISYVQACVGGWIQTVMAALMQAENHKWHKHQRAIKPAWKHCLSPSWWVCAEWRVFSEGSWWSVGGNVVSESAAASKGVIVAVLGLAEFVQKEDDCLQAQDQHYSTNEACSVEGWVLVRGRRRGNRCGSCTGSSWSRGYSRRAGGVTAVSRGNCGSVCIFCGGLRGAAFRGGGGNRGRGGCRVRGNSRRSRRSWSWGGCDRSWAAGVAAGHIFRIKSHVVTANKWCWAINPLAVTGGATCIT